MSARFNLPKASVWADAGNLANLRIAIGIASVGRPETLLKTVMLLAHQLRRPDAILICATTSSDVAGVAESFPASSIIFGPRGLTGQRNLILEAAGKRTDVLVFIDDDFLPDSAYLLETLAVFAANPEVVITTGSVIQDGILSSGLEFDHAVARLASHDEGASRTEDISDVYNGYGCNMAIRLAAAFAHDVQFDENLPLYGWLEDVDFSRRLAKYGRVVVVPKARGIHLGITSGRQSGVRLGYSQIANPYYLARKGTLSWRRGLYLASRNIAANLRGMINPESHVDRAGRAAGNLRAFGDLITGRLSPSRILSL